MANTKQAKLGGKEGYASEPSSLGTPLKAEEIEMAASLMCRAAQFNQVPQIMSELRFLEKSMNERPMTAMALAGMHEALGGMSDATKRRLDLSDDSQSFSAGSPWEFVPPSPDRSSAVDENRSIPLPKGVNCLEEWGKTVCKMDKYVDRNYSYAEMVAESRPFTKAADEMNKYLSFVQNKYGSDGGRNLPVKITPAVDLALYLDRLGWKARKFGKAPGFVRETKA